MKNRLIARFNCAQEVFIFIALMAWEACRNFLSQFEAFKGKYTPGYVDKAVQAVNDAKDIMTESQRNAAAKDARIQLEQLTAKCRTLWQRLKLYIDDAFPKDRIKTMLERAGSAYYEKASADNWSAMRSLIDAATQFMADFKTELAANNNMPTSFPQDFGAVASECIQLSIRFTDLEKKKGQLAIEKNDALNACYDTLISMLKDGQHIFADDKAKHNQFVYSKLLAIARGHQPAKLRGKIVDINGKPIQDVRVYCENAPFDVKTNKKGRYLINRIAAGTYYFIIDRPGYIAQEFEIQIRPGIYNTLNVTLQATQQLQKVA